MDPITTAVVLLLAATVVGLLSIAHVRSRGPDGMNLRTFLAVNFLVANVLSGFAHVLGWSRARGYYEALAGNPPGADSGLTAAAWATFLGGAALWLGMVVRPRGTVHPGASRPPVAPPAPRAPESLYSFVAAHRVMVGGTAALLAAAGAYGLVRVMTAVPENGGRIIAVSGGNARYAFLAGWLPWAVTVLVLVLASRRRTPGPAIWNTLVLTGGLTALAISSTWNGGRAELAYAAFPVLALMLPRLSVLRRPLLVAGSAALAVYVLVTTSRRVGATLDPWSFADWQWGRFSMAAWADRYTDLHGSLGGETLWSALLNVPLALAHFAGLGPGSPFRSMVQISGADLLGDREQIYIVPGFSAEMLLNFGLVGVVVGYFLLGWLAGVVSDAYSRSGSETVRLLLAAFGATLVFQGVVGQLESFMTFLTLGILPVWALWLAERFFRSDRDAGHPLALGPGAALLPAAAGGAPAVRRAW